MNIQENISLKEHSSMRLGGSARYLTEVTSKDDLVEAVKWAEDKNVPVVMIGGGNNVVWGDDGFDGLVLLNKIEGVKEDGVEFTVGGGVWLDDFIKYTVGKGLTGLEFLTSIPGTVGSTPIQNVGAYGQEISTTVTSVEAYDRINHSFVNISKEECDFGYRTSRFKQADKGRFFITSVTFRLQKGNPKPPYYALVQQFCDKNGLAELTPKQGREIVASIRAERLPDTRTNPNNGSFFANPIIEKGLFEKIKAAYPDAPSWPVDTEHVKLPAAWLIERSGFKDLHNPETGMATWHSQPLVLVNESATSTAQLLKFKQKIVNAVKEKFGITMEQEPELID